MRRRTGPIILIASMILGSIAFSHMLKVPVNPIDLNPPTVTVLAAQSRNRHVVLNVQWADPRSKLTWWLLTRRGGGFKASGDVKSGALAIERGGRVVVDVPSWAPAGEYSVSIFAESAEGDAVFQVK